MQDGFEISNEKKPSMIMEWLGFGSTVFLQRETENANGNEGEAFTANDARGSDNWLQQQTEHLVFMVVKLFHLAVVGMQLLLTD